MLANRSAEKRAFKLFGKLMQRWGLHKLMIYNLPPLALRVYERAATYVVPKPDMPEDLRERLVDFIQPDTNRLRGLVGREFRSWSL
jgi:hypothetical protein